MGRHLSGWRPFLLASAPGNDEVHAATRVREKIVAWNLRVKTHPDRGRL
jgi:hypothetical protein